MKTTKNLQLKKPDQTDFYNVDDFNHNADVIDEKFEHIGLESIDYYVDASTGSDVNNGSLSHPFKTITKAIASIPEVMNKRHVVNIHIADGVYSETVHINDLNVELNPTGSGDITVDGILCVRSILQINTPIKISGSNPLFVVRQGSNVSVNQKLIVEANSYVANARAIQCLFNSFILFTDIEVSNVENGVVAEAGGNIRFNGSMTFNNCQNAVTAFPDSLIGSIGAMTCNNTENAFCAYGGIIQTSSLPATGKCDTTYGGQIFTRNLSSDIDDIKKNISDLNSNLVKFRKISGTEINISSLPYNTPTRFTFNAVPNDIDKTKVIGVVFYTSGGFSNCITASFTTIIDSGNIAGNIINTFNGATGTCTITPTILYIN